MRRTKRVVVNSLKESYGDGQPKLDQYLERLTLYRWLPRHDTFEVCNLGHQHEVRYFARKFVRRSEGFWIYDNGYQRLTLPIYVDAQGREYRRCETIDYTNNVYYQSSDHAAWYTRPKPSSSVMRLITTGERIDI